MHLTPMRTYVKRALTAITGKDATKVKEAVAKAIRYLDKAAQKGVIKKQTAARKISRLTRAAARAKGA
jgi:small subunit ribosomal protein S20